MGLNVSKAITQPHSSDDEYDDEQLSPEVRGFMENLSRKKKGAIVFDVQKEIKHLPNLNIKELQNVKKLVINNNRLTALNGGHIVVGIEEILLCQNQILKVVGMECLQQMKIFDVRNNQLESVPQLCDCSGLEELYLDENRIEDINEKFLPCKLQILSISGNTIRKELKLDNLQQLRHLHAERIGMKKLPKLTMCCNLQEVHFAENELQEINGTMLPDRLEKLLVPGNNISNLTDIDHLEKVRIFDINRNKLTSLPELVQCFCLEELHIDANEIKIIDAKALPQSLQLLSVSENTVEEFQNIEHLTGLQTFIMVTNKSPITLPNLSVIPTLRKLSLSSNNILDTGKLHPEIEVLDLSHNSIEDSKKVLSQVKEARYIDLSYNQIRNLSPKDISSTITKLDLSHNHLIDMPNVSAAKQLRHLLLQHNKIKQFPKCENKCVLYIDLSHNEISDFPDFSGYPKLETLNVSHNNIVAIRSQYRRKRIIPFNLCNLDASFNKISSINTALLTGSIKQLNFESNKITRLPSLEKCLNLQNVSLKNNAYLNEIEQLPERVETINLDGLTGTKEISLRRKCFPTEAVHNVLKTALSSSTAKLVSPPEDIFVVDFERVLNYFAGIVEEESKEEEPVKVQVTEDGSSEIESSENGGVYMMEEKNIILCVPNMVEDDDDDDDDDDDTASTMENEAVSKSKTSLRDGDDKIESISIESAKADNNEENIIDSEIVSELVTMKPHGKSFNEHLLLKFPISDEQNLEEYGLIYNVTGNLKKPRWITIPKENPNYKHLDPFFWIVIDGFCCVFMTHFCDFALVKSPSFPEVTSRWLTLATYGKYFEKKKRLEITVVKGCQKCKQKLLADQQKHGKLLRNENYLMIGETDNLSFSLTLENWKIMVKPNDVYPLELVQDCELEEVMQSDRFILSPAMANNRLNLDDELVITVVVSQENGITKNLSGEPVKLSQLTQASDFEASSRPTTGYSRSAGYARPAETAEEVFDDDPQIARTPNTPYKPMGPIGCRCPECPQSNLHKPRSSKGRQNLFHPRLKEEQKDFCNLLEKGNPEKFAEIINILGFKPGSNMVPLTIMQILQTRIEETDDKAYIWKKLWLAIKRVDWREARIALEYLYEKDMILKKIGLLKDHIRLVDIKDSLVSKQVLSSKNEMDYFLNPMYLEGDKLEYIFHHILLVENWRGGQKLGTFNNILKKKGYEGIMEMLTLHE